MFAVLTSILRLLFSCRHKHYSFPITVTKHRGALTRSGAGMYVVCLDCARQFPYDWEQMKVVWTPDKPKGAPEPQKAPAKRQQAVSF
jgi:hypothetical protein